MVDYLNNIAEELKKHDIKPSVHRMRITEYLACKKNHPTADAIYIDLKEDYPTLSKATVYNTLNLLVKSGLAKALTIDDREIRYDYTKPDHGHFQCLTCGTIMDFNVDMGQLDISGLGGHAVMVKDVYFKGICKECLLK